MVQKWPFKALFAQIRLADTELAATRSNRQIKALVVVFRRIENFNPPVAEEAILWPIFTLIVVKKTNLGHSG